jgi:hypothetical protein
MQEQEKSYTREEVDHLVAREVAKQRMNDLERSLSEVKSETLKMWAKFDASFGALQKVIEGRDQSLRDEIERDFATKLEVEQLKGEVSKVWLKVSIPVITVLTIAQFLIGKL